MSLNIKTEPSEVSIVDVSSDEDLPEMVSPKKNALPTFHHPTRPGTPETHCSICLEEFTDKCYPNICIHMFCFECLKRWSAIDSTCPLCKKKFQKIHHSLSEFTHETYEVPRQERELSSPRIFLRPFGEISDVNRPRISARPLGELYDFNRIFRMNLFLDIVRRNERLMNNAYTEEDINRETRPVRELLSLPQHDNIHDLYDPFNERRSSAVGRVRVYSENMWADPLPDLSGRFRECSSTFFRENPAQVHRLQQFIVRDINAIRSIETLRTNTSINDIHLTNLIMRSIINHEIRDAHTTNMLRPYLGVYAAHFCHELYNFANSPYDLLGYDRYVRYTRQQSHSPSYQNAINALYEIRAPPPPPTPPLAVPITYNPHMETIVLDSDDSVTEVESRPYPGDIITIQSSSSDNSDVEILSPLFCPIDVSNSRDQPSTSTGIRESLDRPNNRYNLRRRRLFSHNFNDSSGCPVHISRMAYPPGLRRGRITLDSSSSDEEQLTSVHSSQAVHLKSETACGKKKRKTKKNKLKKRKKTIDNSKSENHIGSRSRSYSESSSSSGDTDLRPNNNCVPIRTSTNIVL